MNSAEELYLNNYTAYGTYNDDEAVDEYDAMEAAESAWERWDGR